MTDAKLARLILKLREKCAIGEIPWEATPSSNVFQATVAGYVVRIAEVASISEDAKDYVITLMDRDGNVLESAADPEFQNLKTEMPDFSAYQSLKFIFGAARRSSLGADKAIELIIKELDQPF